MQLNIQVPNIPLADTAGFAKVWTYNGIVVPLQDVHVQFAHDYATVVLRNFIIQAMMANFQRAQKAAAAAKPLITEK